MPAHILTSRVHLPDSLANERSGMVRLGIAFACATLALLTLPARAVGSSASDMCWGAKINAVGREVAAKLRCHATAARNDMTGDRRCLDRATATFSEAWIGAETKGVCATTVDEASLEAAADGFVGEVVAQLTGSPQGAFLTTVAARKCAAKKLSLAANRVINETICSGQSVRRVLKNGCPSETPNANAIARNWAAIEARGGCATTMDLKSIIREIRLFTKQSRSTLSPPCGTTEAPLCNGSCPAPAFFAFCAPDTITGACTCQP